MMDFIIGLLHPVALVAGLYTCAASVERLRYSRHLMSAAWVWMYLVIFTLSALGSATQVAPLPPSPDFVVQVVYLLHMCTSIAVGAYIRLTTPSWRDGIPRVACSEFGALQ